VGYGEYSIFSQTITYFRLTHPTDDYLFADLVGYGEYSIFSETITYFRLTHPTDDYLFVDKLHGCGARIDDFLT
jgi:hypothetical protein